MSAKPEAIVVGTGLNALGVVRSLAPEGIAITVVDDGEHGPAAHSRYAKASVLKGDLIAHLQGLADRADRPVLFLTQEARVSQISAARGQLSGKLRFLLAEQDLLSALMSKSRFEALASDHGFPVPRSVAVERAIDVPRAEALIFPCIVKPLVKNAEWDKRFKKAYRFEDFAALKRFLADAGDVPAVIVQEWIEGGDSDVYFTLVYRDERHRTCAAFTGRKIRQWPPQVGGTASCMPAPAEHEALLDLTTRFFDAVGFVGMGSMEFKRDPRSGRFVMVEPTVGRSDYQEEVAALNGVNVVRAAYRSLSGLDPLTAPAPSQPKMWVDHVGDERSKAAQPEHKAPDEAAKAQRVDALFRVNDPGPWLADIYERVAARIVGPRS